MSKFRELYEDDITRYGDKAELYIKVFHYLYRKALTATLRPNIFFWKVLFRLWARRRGIEIAANLQIGGGYFYRACI